VALASFDRAIALNPGFAEAFYNRGNALLELKQLEGALASFDRAIALKPDYAEAHANRGNVLRDLNQFDAALASFDRAIALKPDCAKSYSSRGVILHELNHFDLALASLDRAIALKPDFADAYFNRGNVLRDQKRLGEAVRSFEMALGLKGDCDYLFGTLQHTRMHLCDWKGFDSGVAELILKVQQGAKVATPFDALSLMDDSSVQRMVAETFCHYNFPAAAAPMWSGQRYEHARIRVAYVSCDFKRHPAALNNVGVWERHDRSRFEVIAISYGPVIKEDATAEGQMRTRLVKAFDRFLDVGDKSDEQIARIMQELEVDIAVDISGTMRDARPGIFAHRPAPVQVNLYGYTSGAPYMDYLVADRVVIPPEHEDGYSEKVVCLPGAWSSSDTSRQVSSRQFTRGEMGLPERGVVYCSFNNAYKFNPQMFDVWMRILQRVPGSVLWLQGGGQEGVKENLRREASARGVEPSRLVFADRLESMAEHLARHRLADVFLDTLPFNAQTTAMDALWAGLPVLTCLGRSSFGRIAGSVLMALGMEELVSQDWQGYEAQAARIGLESGYAKSLKEKLERNRKESPLFDTARLTRHMESAYEQMHERVRQGW
jgi:predicted O-linked N-acetylglucosamine transferase (SPINDLY family)